jgi:mannose-6-phosphate isomerase-like protein (cupin superfamily)
VVGSNGVSKCRMSKIDIARRVFLQLAAGALPASLLAQQGIGAPAAKAVRVAAGADREGQKRAVGLSSTTYKVLTKETDGALFVLEQSNHQKGGPSRHLHHNEDELFYAVEGDYILEVGSDRFHLKPGDCVLGPRGVPHAWAFAGGTPGRLLISFAPAGKMEAFFNERERAGIKPGAYASTANDAALLHAFGMELVGPPLILE